jgi:hypothetical protein
MRFRTVGLGAFALVVQVAWLQVNCTSDNLNPGSGGTSGLGPKPASVTSRRFMVLRKATPETESDAELAPEKREALRKLRAGRRADLLASEAMRPSARGRRCNNSIGGTAFTDGPFAESKELIAGFVIIEVGSLDEASRWAARYLTSVHSDEADLLALEDPPAQR